MSEVKTKRGWLADRQRVATGAYHERRYISYAYGCTGDVPERGLKKLTPKIVGQVIEEMKAGNPHAVIMRVDLMAELDRRGYIYHDAPETPTE
jgi:hypothetical protein